MAPLSFILSMLLLLIVSDGAGTIDNSAADKIFMGQSYGCNLSYNRNALDQYDQPECASSAAIAQACPCQSVPYYRARITAAFPDPTNYYFKLTNYSVLNFYAELASVYILDTSYFVMAEPQGTDTNSMYGCDSSRSWAELYDVDTAQWYQIPTDCSEVRTNSGLRSVLRLQGGPTFNGQNYINKYKTNLIQFYIAWDTQSPSGFIYAQGLELNYISVVTTSPTIMPSNNPSLNPTSLNPTSHPTSNPALNPTFAPPSPVSVQTNLPTHTLTSIPTSNPTNTVTSEPTSNPTVNPTHSTTGSTNNPSANPIAIVPTSNPSSIPSESPTITGPGNSANSAKRFLNTYHLISVVIILFVNM